MTVTEATHPEWSPTGNLEISGLNGRDIRTLRAALGFFVQRASVRTMLALLAVALPVRIWMGGWTWWDAVVPVVLLALEPFTEWVIHIRVLHFQPRERRGRVVDLPAAQSHRFHHLHPHDPMTSFVPLRDMLSLLAVVVVGVGIITRSPALVLTALTVALVIFLTYEWTHFLIHTAVPAKSRYYKHLVTSHRNHHFRNEHYWLGVTVTLGDRVLGTAPEKHEVPLSPTARTLGVG